MSYDLFLYQKNGLKKPLEDDVLKLKLCKPQYSIEISVNSFEVSGSDEDGSFNDPYYYQKDKGCYWTYCSYGVNSDTFEIFRKRVCRVAQKLDLLIQDQQLGTEELFTSENYFNNYECSKRFRFAQNSSKLVSRGAIDIRTVSFLKTMKPPWLTEVSLSERFVQYYIVSSIPDNNQLVYLSPGENLICAGKLNIGKTLEETINEYIFECTGSNKYNLIKIIRNNDSAKKRTGEILPRDAIFIKVPYFQPQKNFNQENYSWLSV